MLLVGCAVFAAGKFDQEALLRQIGRAVERKDLPELEALKGRCRRSNSTILNVYNLAVFYVDPTHYEQEFVRSFPVDKQGVMGDVQILHSKAKMVSRFFAYTALGRLAKAGEMAAMRKLALEYAVSDGMPAESLGDDLSTTARMDPRGVLAALASLPSAVRQELAGDVYLWCRGHSVIAKVATENLMERRLQQAIRKAETKCHARG
jgi:hypothetical protein